MRNRTDGENWLGVARIAVLLMMALLMLILGIMLIVATVVAAMNGDFRVTQILLIVLAFSGCYFCLAMTQSVIDWLNR